MKKRCALPLALLFFYGALANVRLPRIFCDHMVLQRNQVIPVWGWAAPKEKIALRFHGKLFKTVAGRDGKWAMHLSPEGEGGPYEMVIQGNNKIILHDVMVGEVWICSGQSNMEMPIAGWGKINHYQEEIAGADYPWIRQFLVTKSVSATPKDDVAGGDWTVCSPATAGDFTAAGFFFARELSRELHIAIGLINASWGGTMVETWISRDAFESSDEFRNMIASMPKADLDSMTRSRFAALEKTIASLQGNYESHPETGPWKDAAFEDGHWPQMKLPGLWENQSLGLEDLDGLVWFRRTVIIDDVDAGKPATLNLAKIDDSDESYVNGTRVGGMKNSYNENRSYQVPAGVLKPGRNVIAVRVEDTGGGGGIFGNAADMKLTIGTKVLALDGNWHFRVESIYGGGSHSSPNSFPTLLYNAMISPLIPYGIRGALWYQGEANTDRAFQYRQAFPLMIADWRARWKQGDFPFYFVQLASFGAAHGDSHRGSTWAELREAQAMTLRLPHTGMAVTTDIGDSGDIHPKNKQEVGRRLAALALVNVYGQTKECSGPQFRSMQLDGARVVLSFDHLGAGLYAKDKYGYLKGFEVAGQDRHFYWARASLRGDQVILSADSVSVPVAVRYGWADDALEANLFNKEGFPAIPFRTDDWSGLTVGRKYLIGM